jgi:hypothetical protein
MSTVVTKLYTWSPNKLLRCNSIFTYGAAEQPGGDAKVKFWLLFNNNKKINLPTYNFYGLEPPRFNKKISQRYTIATIRFAQSSLLPIGWHRSAHFLHRFLFPIAGNCVLLANLGTK